MCWTNDKGKVHCYDAPGKWYYENSLFIDKDTFFIYKVPVQVVGKKKIYSASDGGFYYWYGTLKQTDTGSVLNLIMNNCDYCGREEKTDSTTGFNYPVSKIKNYKFTTIPKGIKIGDVIYYKALQKNKYFPSKVMFYFDSNSIYRNDPIGQYKLISIGIKNFLQTRELKLDNDTLRINIDRINDNATVETLDPDNLKIDTSGIVFKFYSQKELKKLTAILNRPIRYIEVGQIIDFWKAARIKFEYKISLPKSVHKFSERQLSNLFEYNKVGTDYLLVDKLPENSWWLIEQK